MTTASDQADSTADVDVEELQSELAQIKDAMGLQERYPSMFHLWLVFGVLVLFASVGSQVVVLYDLPGWGHSLSWAFFMGLGFVYQWFQNQGTPETSDGTTPNGWIQAAAVVAYLLAIFVIVGPHLNAEPGVETSVTFALIVGAIAVIYLVQGNVLKAHYIRKRDRYAFYVGGSWMLLYAAVMPNVQLLQEWGYVVYGVLYAAHGIASYVILSKQT